MILILYDSSKASDPGWVEDNPEINAKQWLLRFRNLQDVYTRRISSDVDHDNTGEFGSLDELFGHPAIGKADFSSRGHGVWHYDRYLYQVFVPDGADDAERYWCAVAWPDHEALLANPGLNTFIIDWRGKVHSQRAEEKEAGANWIIEDLYKKTSYESDLKGAKCPY